MARPFPGQAASISTGRLDRKLANPTESDQSIADCGLRIADWLKPVRNLRPKLRIDVFGVGLIHAASIGG